MDTIYSPTMHTINEREGTDLISVVVAPFHCKLKRPALAIVSNGPIVL